MNEDFLYVKNAMIQCAKTAGLLAVIGQSGSGKSVMRKEFRNELNEKHRDVRVINVEAFDKSRLNASALCEAIVQDLKPGTVMRSSLEGRARQVRDVLEQSHNAGQKHVMLIEEAHDIPVTTLKFMKRFWEMESGGTTRMLAIVLIGQTEMAHKLDLRQNWQAREFINRCEVAELAPLDAHLKNFIAHKFKLINVDVTTVIAEDAYAAIHQVLVEKTQSGTRNGLQPLRVQVLLTKAFNKAAQVGAQQITAEIIRGV
jgi:type II secretory pathway predicted ATPase ExeA